MLYVASLWLTPAYQNGSDHLMWGFLGVTRRLSTVQRMIAISMMGVLCTTATDVLEAHSNLMPTSPLLQNTCHHAIIRIAALPATHPLYIPLHHTAKYLISFHHSTLYKLAHHYSIIPDKIKTLTPAFHPTA